MRFLEDKIILPDNEFKKFIHLVVYKCWKVEDEESLKLAADYLNLSVDKFKSFKTICDETYVG